MGSGFGQSSAGSGAEASREHSYRLAVSFSEPWPLPMSGRRILTKSCTIRFNDIAWTTGNDDQSRGIVAGALENGSLDLWNADKLLSGDG